MIVKFSPIGIVPTSFPEIAANKGTELPRAVQRKVVRFNNDAPSQVVK